jgi:hypothetical protein
VQHARQPVAGCGPSSSAENKNSWGVSGGTAASSLAGAGGTVSVVSSTSQSVTVRRFSACCFLEEKFEQPTRRLRAEIVVRGRRQIVSVDVRLVFLDEI